tara:strand:+ start:523 stop:921 length:399 start_codon:yes stop_codon:yes gene_type:complete
MAFVDPIGDMITRIRNAQMRSLSSVKIPGSKFRASILDVLKKEGYISDYKFLTDVKDKNSLTVSLKYDNGNPVIKEIKRVSKPGRRIYAKADSIPLIQNGLGVAIVSTSKGIMSDNDAKNKNIGGEIICRVF